MTLSREPCWSLEELCGAVADALASGYPGPASARVREVPDGRSVRYYATLGLVDKPSRGAGGGRGRTAGYGERHLVQLVAIKRLQARGLSLAEVQARLLGLSDDELRAVAGPVEAPAQGRAAGPAAPAARRDEFWRVGPAGEEPPTSSTGPAPVLSTGVPLAPGVTLLVDARRPLGAGDVEEIRAAAGALLRLLERQGLVAGEGGEERRRR